jgi:hypothetical protein
VNHIHLNIEEIKELIKLRYRQMIESPDVKIRPLYIEGHSGIGKTQIIRQAAQELTEELASILGGNAVECKTMNLQFTERPEFMGLAYLTEDHRTAFAFPSLLPESGYGLYFLDEANRVERDIRSGMLTLLEDRAINGHKIGKYWMPILAGNPIDEKYETNEFDVALADRVAKIIMAGDPQMAISYFKRKYAGHPLVEFLSSHQDFISFAGDGISPRTFEYAIRATPNFAKMTDTLKYIVLAAELGQSAASTVIAFLRDTSTPKYDDVVGGVDTAKEWLSQNRDRNDVITGINKALIADLKHRVASSKTFTSNEVENIRNYIIHVGDEHKQAIMLEASKENVTMELMSNFIQGTALVGFFVKLLANVSLREQKAT